MSPLLLVVRHSTLLPSQSAAVVQGAPVARVWLTQIPSREQVVPKSLQD
jgi:hypothetical protein